MMEVVKYAVVRRDSQGVDDVWIEVNRCKLSRFQSNIFELEGHRGSKHIQFFFKSGVDIQCRIQDDDFVKFGGKEYVDEIELETNIRFERMDKGVFWFGFYLDEQGNRVSANIVSKKSIECTLAVDEIGTIDDSEGSNM